MNFFFLRFGCKHEIDKNIFVLFLPLLIWRKVDKCGVQSGSCKSCIFTIMICALGILLILFFVWLFFFANCNDVHFADWNNELLEKEKKHIHFVNWNNIHF